MDTDDVTYHLQEIIDECRADAQTWFPDAAQQLDHHLLALAGEVGEACNIVKKIQRGSLILDERVHLMLCQEITDVFIYVCNIAGIMQFDLARAYQAKREINQERFGRP